MKVTFVYPDTLECDPTYKGAFYSGIGLLSAVLKREGHITSLIHVTDPNYQDEDFRRDVQMHSPDLIAFSSTMNSYVSVRKLAGALAAEKDRAQVIYGGIHPTLAPEECINTPGINMICVGEGEGCLSDVARALEQGKSLDGIANLWIKKGYDIIRNPSRELITDLDSIPYADRDLFDYPWLFNERKGVATLMASRGCPNSCSYCANKALRNLYQNQGAYVRFRSVANVINEVKQVRAKYPFIKRLQFDDDILFMKKKWAEEFVEHFRKEVGLPFCCNIHPTLCREDIIRMLAKAGCYELRIGLESGNEKIRSEVLNRHMDNDTIIQAFNLARSCGIRVKSFNMIGIPHENADRILDTIKLNAKAQVDDIQHSIFHPYPGTRLFDLCREENLISKRSVSSYYMGSVLDLPELTMDQIGMFQLYFHTFVAVYKKLYNLPGAASKSAVRALDFILIRRNAPLILKAARPFAKVMKALSGGAGSESGYSCSVKSRGMGAAE